MFLHFFVSLLALAAIVQATAIPSPNILERRLVDIPLENRDAGGVFVCTDPNFAGQCTYFSPATIGTCVQIASATFFEQVTSFGPDQGASCQIFLDNNCEDCLDCKPPLQFPGTPNLSATNPPFDDHIQSFLCTPN
ncbi:hypothetical protein BGZ60DRAFT_569604 [Tricladium varicosporioides]|nr:hypothetical protein BGZ60DRAFT_569604 [Hymenoscyphus varicosporioides]